MHCGQWIQMLPKQAWMWQGHIPSGRAEASSPTKINKGHFVLYSAVCISWANNTPGCNFIWNRLNTNILINHTNKTSATIYQSPFYQLQSTHILPLFRWKRKNAAGCNQRVQGNHFKNLNVLPWQTLCKCSNNKMGWDLMALYSTNAMELIPKYHSLDLSNQSGMKPKWNASNLHLP